MILTKSKIYEGRVFNSELVEKLFRRCFEIKSTKNDFRQIGYAICKNYVKLVYLFSRKGFRDWNRAMIHAAENNNKHLINFFIQKGGKDWTGMICSAIANCYPDLLDSFIEERLIRSWSLQLNRAISYGQEKLMHYILSKDCVSWQVGVDAAKSKGSKSLINFFKKRLT